MRVLAISDLHTDFPENLRAVERIPPGEYLDDALLVAGDVAETLDTLEATLSLLRARFRRVFFVPGNHDLWARVGGDSLEKFHRVLELCARLGVETGPGRVGGAWVVPLFSWYEPEFDSYGDAEDTEMEAWADFHFCRWPEGVESPSAHFLELNQSRLREYDLPVITFSHFLPRRDLLPAARFLRFRGLPLVAGSAGLDEQLRRVGARVHVFGHSHIDCDSVVQGVRYVQNALRYPRDRGSAPLRLAWVWGER